MKKLLFLITSLTLVGCTADQSQSGPTIFEGRIIGYNGEYTEFFLPVDSGYREIQIQVNEDGTFCDTIDFGADYFDAALFADKFMFRTCMQQGKHYHAEFDITQEGVESNYSFTGEGAAENDFVKHFWGSNDMEIIAQSKSFKEGQTILNETFGALISELQQIHNKPFVAYWTEQIQQTKVRIACYSPFYLTQLNGQYAEDADFRAFAAAHLNLPEAERTQTWQQVLTNASYMFTDVNATELLKAAAALAITPEQKEQAMTLMLKALVGAGNTLTIKPAYEYYQEQVTNAELLQSVEAECRNAIMLAPGTEAPEIEFRDQKGRVHHLADFRGKPLYIDLWASWCGPCCKEIPYLAKFVEALGKNPDIQCISISIDDNESDWTRKLAEEPDTWPQFLATPMGQQSINQQYFVQSIPRFLLIDAEGRIASVNAPRPSSEDLLEALRALLPMH